MPGLTNKRILLGVTGGIAAYKSADIVRRLREAGAAVRVVMTEAAGQFITPLTLETVSGQPVYSQLLGPETDSAMDHIALARWADAVLIAPATANFLARLNQGRAEDLLSTVCLATEAPLAVAPAMNRQMWQNPATERNLFGLRQLGIHIFGPATGNQACGETGPGRMLEPVELAQKTVDLFASGALEGLTVLITAGPTWEALDPVRGLTNRSSGKMGYAVAEAAVEAGAQVILISGPTALPPPERIKIKQVTSAEDMLAAVNKYIDPTDIFIGVAAVADYRPKTPSSQKIKKDAETLQLELVRNPDILAAVAAREDPPFTVGFAAETHDPVRHAQEKLRRKGLDLIVANQVGGKHTGFESDDNALILIDHQGQIELEKQAKTRLARKLIQHIATRYNEKNTAQNTRRSHR